jgi:hypothetical protein
MVVFSDPIWSGATTTTWGAPFHYQRLPDDLEMAERVINGAHRNDLVLATDELSISVTVLTTRIHSVDPRKYYMDYLSDDPGFHYFKREQLTRFVDSAGPFHRAATKRNLRILGVDVVCLAPSKQSRIRWVTHLGYRDAYSSSTYRCLTR